MSPVLADGDYIIIKKRRSFRAGLIYVIKHSDLGTIVKRLRSTENGRLLFEGDNSKSTPGALIAPVEPARVIGQAWLRIGKSGLQKL